MYLGIDLGTSEVKIALMDDAHRMVDTTSAPLTNERPQPNWSEQAPSQWIFATTQALQVLRGRHGAAWASIRAIGLSGQMHGAVLLDEADQPLRPAILWNDGRSAAQCVELVCAVPDFYERSANLAMPGFTAPKLLWVRQHEPDLFARTRRVLLPKDYLRFVLTGQFATDPSDASGTLWLNPKTRQWDDALLAASGLSVQAMPTLCDGSAVTGVLQPELAQSWGLGANVVVAGGAGDNAASAIGVGALNPGQGFISLGTSGVAFVVTDQLRADPQRAIHAFCHTLPGRWHQMTVMLSAASCLAWWKSISGASSEAALLAELEDAWAPSPTSPLFVPYLTGERTPHNDANVRGMFFGLDAAHRTRDLTYAVIEGVAFAMADGLDAMRAAGTHINRLALVGGGARSNYWAQLLADVLDVELYIPADGFNAAALGAARLGAMAAGVPESDLLGASPEHAMTFRPNGQRREFLHDRLRTYRQLYPRLRDITP
jgi:xylulokinase